MPRDYSSSGPAQQLAEAGVDAGTLVMNREVYADVWIPGVEVIPRRVFAQKHRGLFGELGREGEGRLGEIGLWPRQWAAATMFAGTAKGFHIHPPHVPDGTDPAGWFRRLFPDGPPSLRPYDKEQWDVMFFLTGRMELFLADEREGLGGRRMRIFIGGDSHCGPDNAAVVIPPGVAHGLRAEGSEDVWMVYGTSTVFDPDNEGRIASEVETAALPPGWDSYFAG